METLNAKVTHDSDKHGIEIEVENNVIVIPLSEDNPMAVKSAFNKLLIRLKDGPFQLRLNNVDGDLFSQVAFEYVTQLNRELAETYQEMISYEMALGHTNQ